MNFPFHTRRFPRARHALAVFLIGPRFQRIHGRDLPVWYVYAGDCNARPTATVEERNTYEEANTLAEEIRAHYGIRRIIENEVPPSEQQPVHLYELKPFHAPPAAEVKVGDYLHHMGCRSRIVAVTPTTITIRYQPLPHERTTVGGSAIVIYSEPRDIVLHRRADLEIHSA